jgi:protein-tyrosine-phosphatase
MSLEERARLHAALGDPQRLAMVDELFLSDRTFQELADVARLPGNLAAHHLSVLESAGLIERHVSEGDRRRRYISLRSERLNGLLSGPTLTPTFVVFVCSHNSARSQFAAALWRERTGQVAESAGTDPAPSVHPRAVKVAAEFGLDLRGAVPQAIGDLSRSPDLVVSVCDRSRESGPGFDCPQLHWSIPDPVADGKLDSFRRAFKSITTRVDQLAAAAAAA